MYWADRTSDCQKVARLNADKTVTHVGNRCFYNIRKIETLPDGSLFLVDFQDIKKIDPAGNVKVVANKIANKKWVTSNPENQNAVMGIWSDKQGNLYAAVSSARLVKKFDSQGREFTAFKSASPWSPSGGLVDSRGRLWILEYDPLNAVRVVCALADGNTQTYTP
jgi:streptogramin lyase